MRDDANAGNCLHGELSSEQLNNLRNLISHAVKSADNWEAFYGLAPLAERYLRKSAYLHVHIVPNSASVEKLANLCVTFQVW